MQNIVFSETDLLKIAYEGISNRLPPDWSLHYLDSWRERPIGRVHIDGAFEITDPEGRSAIVVLEAKRGQVDARQVFQLKDYLWYVLSAQGNDTLAPYLPGGVGLMVVAPYIGPLAKERLSEAGVSFVDLTGNIRFVLNRPAIFIEAQGADRNPYRENVPLRSLRGRGAARAVRGLLDYRPPFGIRELAIATENSASTISRVSDLLERESILYREERRGRILSVDWERLLRRWADDYDFMGANRITAWLEPRGMRVLFDKLRRADFEYAVTGSFAAVRIAPVAEPRLAVIYAANRAAAAKSLGLRPADTGGNVLIGRPFDPVVFQRTQQDDEIMYVSVTQTVADLIKGPGRGPSEAESLIEWMHHREDVWQIPMMNST